VFKSGAELDRIFDLDESGKARKYGSSFSRRDVNTGDASFDRRDGEESCRLGDRSGDELTRMVDGERRTGDEEGESLDISSGGGYPNDDDDDDGDKPGISSLDNEGRVSSIDRGLLSDNLSMMRTFDKSPSSP
jgi:hypothetical protein